MAPTVVHGFRISSSRVKPIDNSRKETSIHESGNKANVNVVRRKSLPSKKRHRARYSNSIHQVTKIARRHRSLLQVVPKELLTQSIPNWQQNFATNNESEQRPVGRTHVTDVLEVNSTSIVVPGDPSNSSYRSQNGQKVDNSKHRRQAAISPSKFSLRAVSPLNDQFAMYPADKETGLLTSVNHSNPTKFEGEANGDSDRTIKTSANQSKSINVFSEPKNQLQKWRKMKCCNSIPCLPLCAILSLVGAVLLLTGLAVLFVDLFGSHQSTTGSTSITTSTTTQITSITTTTTQTTSTTTITTQSTSTTTITTQTTRTTSSTSTTFSTSSTSITTTTTCSPIFDSNSSLIAYFPMDSVPSYLTDVGASLTATAVSVTNIVGERNEALSFTGTVNSYFQISNLISLGTVNAPFSIAVYVSPNVLFGTVVHISMHISGNGGWCLPFIGFASTTQLAIQVWGGTTANYVLGPILPLNSWTHVVQTWSSANGLSLYINGVLYAQDSTVTVYFASGAANYLTLASTLQIIPYPMNVCSTTGVLGGLGYYNGSIDELRVYSRELSGLEVCALAKY